MQTGSYALVYQVCPSIMMQAWPCFCRHGLIVTRYTQLET